MPECWVQGTVSATCCDLSRRSSVDKGPETIDTAHFRKNHLPNLVEQYKRFGFGNLTLDIKVCQEKTQQQAEDFSCTK